MTMMILCSVTWDMLLNLSVFGRSSHLSKGSTMSFPPTLKSCRRDKQKIRCLKSINDSTSRRQKKTRIRNVILKSQGISISEMLETNVFLRTRCVAE